MNDRGFTLVELLVVIAIIGMLSAIVLASSKQCLASLIAAKTAANQQSTGLGYSFDRDLEINMTGEDVRALQRFLNANGFPPADSGPGSSENETDSFGMRTYSALAKFQAAHGTLDWLLRPTDPPADFGDDRATIALRYPVDGA